MFLQDVTANTREQIKQIRNFGDGHLKELDEILKEFNLWYADNENILCSSLKNPVQNEKNGIIKI